jgi:hypothetical protein
MTPKYIYIGTTKVFIAYNASKINKIGTFGMQTHHLATLALTVLFAVSY